MISHDRRRVLRGLQILVLLSAVASPSLAGPGAGGGSHTPGWQDTTNNRHFLKNTNAAGAPDLDFRFGVGGQVVFKVYGDWDGDGDFTPGFFDPAANRWYLRNSNDAGIPNFDFVFGVKGTPVDTDDLIPVVGDWDGDGDWTVGFFDRLNNRWFLRNSNSTGAPDLDFVFGVVSAPTPTSTVPRTGDWDGAGGTTVGFFDSVNFRWFLRNSNSSGAPNEDFFFPVDQSGSNVKALVGDFNGDGSTTVGYVVLDANRWLLRNSNSNGTPDFDFVYGVKAPLTVGVEPCIGDWDGTTAGP